MILTPALCRAARGFLDWTQIDLADRSGVSRSTIRDYEGDRHKLHRATEAQLRMALESGGISFFHVEGHEIGICTKTPEADIAAPAQAESCEILEASGEHNETAVRKTSR